VNASVLHHLERGGGFVALPPLTTPKRAGEAAWPDLRTDCRHMLSRALAKCGLRIFPVPRLCLPRQDATADDACQPSPGTRNALSGVHIRHRWELSPNPGPWRGSAALRLDAAFLGACCGLWCRPPAVRPGLAEANGGWTNTATDAIGNVEARRHSRGSRHADN